MILSDDEIQSIVSRLSSQDANDRVKAAAELGEVGTPKEASYLLKAAYEDEASTVRQMAIQAYHEILRQGAFEEIRKAALSHFDEYVKMYAVVILGEFEGNLVGELLASLLESDNPNIQAATLKSMIHAHTPENGDRVFTLLVESSDTLVKRNCIEALANWRYKRAQDYINEDIFQKMPSDKELVTIAAFFLALFGNKDARNYLMKGEIEEFIRISMKNNTYSGRKGLLSALTV